MTTESKKTEKKNVSSAGTALSALSKNAPPIQLANPKPLEAWEGENANPEPLPNTDGWDAAALPLVEKAFADDRLFHATNYTSERGQKRPVEARVSDAAVAAALRLTGQHPA